MKVKSIPAWALAAGGLGLVFLLAQQSDSMRRKAYQIGREASERSGGTLPAPPRSWLPPEQETLPGTGVGYRPGVLPALDPWYYDLFPNARAGGDQMMYAGGSPGFYGGGSGELVMNQPGFTSGQPFGTYYRPG